MTLRQLVRLSALERSCGVSAFRGKKLSSFSVTPLIYLFSVRFYGQQPWQHRPTLQHPQQTDPTSVTPQHHPRVSAPNGTFPAALNGVNSPPYSPNHVPHSPGHPGSAPEHLSRGDRRSQGPQDMTFVSSHFCLPEGAIEEFLKRKNLRYRLENNDYRVENCPFCHPHQNKTSNLWKLYISSQNGMFYCFRCQARGSWYDLHRRLGSRHATDMNEAKKPDPILPPQHWTETYQKNLFQDPHFATVLKYLQEKRGLHPNVLQKYLVGATTNFFRDGESSRQEMCITFPMIDVAKMNKEPRSIQKEDQDRSSGQDAANPRQLQFTTVRHKIRSVEDKSHMLLLPKGGGWGLFGWHTVPSTATEIVITEGEYDAMAVHQDTGLPAVSLPNGASSLPVELLPRLERFTRIYLWMDDDLVGQQGAEKFVQKLGERRCLIVKTKNGDPSGPKDANDALLQKKDLMSLIKAAKPKPHAQLISFAELKDDIYNHLSNWHETSGMESKTLPELNSFVMGFRRGEITILTGPTGIGKTSLLSQISLDYAKQGVSTLWGSFEIKSQILISKMMTQLHGSSLRNCTPDVFERVSNQFAELPLHFMRFFGSTTVDKVLDVMQFAVYVYDVQHVILDNLQFMTSGQGRGYEKFDLQDSAMEAFRKFATDHDVHITIVIHPRKLKSESILSTYDVFGTAKATQEADNILIIQAGEQYKYLDIKKNRFSGRLGTIPLGYNEHSEQFYALPKKLLEAIEEDRKQQRKSKPAASETDRA